MMDLIPQIIVKPVGSTCNLNCRYCYYTEKMYLYDDRPNSIRMSNEVIEAHIRSIIAGYENVDASEICFSWQGGEPTLLGVDVYRSIVALQKKLCPPGKKISNALQTNGTLIDDEWAKFFADNDFLIGISVDGPAELHDQNRKYRNGKPSHARVIEGLNCLQKANVDINTLTTVNRNNAKFPLEVYNYLKLLGIKHMQFIPVVERRKSNGSLSGPPRLDSPTEKYTVTPWSVDPEDYGHFLCTIFDRWTVEDLGDVFIQTFEVHIGTLMGGPASLCCFSETCGFAPALEYNGDLFACDHYVYQEYRLGNILETPLTELVKAPSQIAFGLDKKHSLPLTCHDCKYKFACYGGCPKHRFIKAPKGPSQNYLCKGYYRFFKHAEPIMNLISDGILSRIPTLQLRKMARNLRAELTMASRSVKPGRNELCLCGSGRKYKKCCAQMGQLKRT